MFWSIYSAVLRLSLGLMLLGSVSFSMVTVLGVVTERRFKKLSMVMLQFFAVAALFVGMLLAIKGLSWLGNVIVNHVMVHQGTIYFR